MAARPIVYLTRPIPEPYRSRLAEHAEIRTWEGETAPPRRTVLHDVAEAEGFLATMALETVDRELIEAAPRLKVICNNGVGVNNIDVVYATERGIVVGNTPGAATEGIADQAFGLMLAAARRIVEQDALVKRGDWSTWGLMEGLGRDVHGATLGIIGMGGSGQAMARRGRGFDMRILYFSRTRKPELEPILGLEWVELDELLRRSDFVSLNLPLTEASRGLLGERELRLMQPTAFLINIARGAIVDEPALVRALGEGWIAGAGLDVFEVEPLPPDHPLLRLPNCITTPHRAGSTWGCRANQVGMSVENLLAGVEGRPLLSCVNPEALSRREAR